MLMCVGVLLSAFTLNALADTVSIAAVVPAPPLTQGAVINSPSDGSQTSTEATTVAGSCPANSYVDLTDNASFVGSYDCEEGGFTVVLDLSVGSNELQAQDYNITNTAGPTTPTVTVTYTPTLTTSPSGGGTSTTLPSSAANSPVPTAPITSPAVVTPVATPDQLIVTQVDLSIPYISQNITPIVSYQPTLTGIAPPYSYVVIIIHSNFYTCTTYANAQGYWSCQVPSDLPSEIHTVNVSAKTPQGSDLSYPTFTIKVINASPPKVTVPSPFHITSSYTYKVETVGQTVSYNIHMTGGTAPYAYTIQWGDGKTSTMVRQTADDFTISHKYSWVNASLASEIVRVQAIDASGQSSTLQLDALIRNPAYHSVVANITKSSGLWGLFGHTRPWLWILWPGYVIVILLVFSFWLGEREELAILLGGKRRPPLKVKHHHGGH